MRWQLGEKAFLQMEEGQRGEMKASSGLEEGSTVHDSALRLPISYSPHRCDKIFYKRQLNERKVNLRRNMSTMVWKVGWQELEADGPIVSSVRKHGATVLDLLPPFYLAFQARAQVDGQCLLFGELN